MTRTHTLCANRLMLLAFKVLGCVHLEFGDSYWSGHTLANDQTAGAIRRVIHTELEACVTAINRNDKKEALDQLSEATAKLRRLAAELIRQFG